jgi:hypothetical protein
VVPAISFYVFAPAAYDWAAPAQRAGREAAAYFQRLVRSGTRRSRRASRHPTTCSAA